jgi:hypothetical protein
MPTSTHKHYIYSYSFTFIHMHVTLACSTFSAKAGKGVFASCSASTKSRRSAAGSPSLPPGLPEVMHAVLSVWVIGGQGSLVWLSSHAVVGERRERGACCLARSSSSTSLCWLPVVLF